VGIPIDCRAEAFNGLLGPRNLNPAYPNELPLSPGRATIVAEERSGDRA
jgi:hypothetical protein